MEKETVMKLAEMAGFGGNNRNTFGTRLVKLASLIEAELKKQSQQPAASQPQNLK